MDSLSAVVVFLSLVLHCLLAWYYLRARLTEWRGWSCAAMMSLVALMALLTGCTAINPDNPVIDPPEQLTIGILIDTELDRESAMTLLDYAQGEMWAEHGCAISYPYIGAWRRAGFNHAEIWADIYRRDLGGADRLLVLVGRDWRDFIWGIVMPEIIGAVSSYDLKRGYVVAEMGSFNQAISFMTPKRMIIHEIQHMRGYTD